VLQSKADFKRYERDKTTAEVSQLIHKLSLIQKNRKGKETYRCPVFQRIFKTEASSRSIKRNKKSLATKLSPLSVLSDV